METITGFHITGLTLEGFKSYAEEVTFHFGHSNLIRGGNGEGKSSIADAIAFAITGAPFFGESGQQDRLYSEGGDSLSIRMDFIDDKGQCHCLVRKRAKAKGKDKMSIWYDDAPIRQLDLDYLFGERDVFLSIFNPLYFIERLGEQGRALLERYLPGIPHEEVMVRLDELTRSTLEDQNVLSGEGYLRRLRDQQAQVEKEITQAEGLRDYLRERENRYNQAHAGLKEELAGVEERTAALEKGRTEGIDLSALEEHYAELCARYEELVRDGPADVNDVEAEIEAARQILADRRAKTYESAYTTSAAEAEAAVKVLREQYETLRRDFAALKASTTICPTCGVNMTTEEMDVARQSLAKRLEAVLDEGRAKSAQLQEIWELDEKALGVFEQFRAADIAAAEAALDALRVKLDARRAEAAEEHRLELEKSRVEVLEADHLRQLGGLTEEASADLAALTARREILMGELEALDAPEEDTSAGRTADISELRSRLEDLSKKANAAKRYIETRVELQFKYFELSRVTISLYDMVKTTGELRGTFKFIFDGKPYRWLSMSEKIRAGMEVSLLVQRLTGRCYPLFVDNGESIPTMGDFRPTGQSFVARVVAGLPLEVKVFGEVPEATAPPAATAA